MPTAKVKILDEVNCVIVGLRPDHATYFWDEFAATAPNYFFNPKFKLGQWDGKIRFFQKTGKTYVYLLDEIVPKLSGLGYDISLEDQRNVQVPEVQLITEDYFSHIWHPDFNSYIKLRHYQVDAVNSVITDPPGIIIAGTGAGKTIMAAALCDVYGKHGLKTVTIVPSKDLIEQTYAEYKICELDAGRYYSETKELDHQHMVTTWQSLKNNLTLMHHFDMVLVDECHGAKGQILQKLLIEHGSHIALRFGLTGTLPKPETDAMAVRVCLNTVRYVITAKQLMDEGYLAKLDIDILQLEENFDKEYADYITEFNNSKKLGERKLTLTQFKDKYFPDYTAEKRYLQSNKERIEWIADYISIKRDEKKGNVFCLVDGVRFGQKLTECIDGAVFVHGKDKQKARQEIYELFKDNDNLVVIATVHIASTGLNIKRIFNMMFIDVGKSFIRIIQTIGRGLRKADDKDSILVTDICSDLKYSKRHLSERIKFYKEAQYKHKKQKIRYSDVNI